MDGPSVTGPQGGRPPVPSTVYSTQFVVDSMQNGSMAPLETYVIPCLSQVGHIVQQCGMDPYVSQPASLVDELVGMWNELSRCVLHAIFQAYGLKSCMVMALAVC